MRKTNGFSLIELMIALGVLTIIATVAVPKVQVWNARNRGLQTVIEIISDFSKARSIAGYTVVGDKTNGKITLEGESTTMPLYVGVRLQTAIVFRSREYAIYQKESMKLSNWNASAKLLKKNILFDTVSIVKIDGFPVMGNYYDPTDFTNRIVFTSNGLVKKQESADVSESESLATADKVSCGGVSSPMSNRVFGAVVKSKIGGTSNDAVWYRIEIDQAGEYFICMAFSNATTYSPSIFSNNGNPLSI